MSTKMILENLISENSSSLQELKQLYTRLGISDEDFERDQAYLKQSFSEMSKIWLENFEKIDKVNYIMLSEAPLWGDAKSYIYNESTPFTQFFYKSDLERALNDGTIFSSKRAFLKKLNEIGFLIIDISPFALNQKTKLNYSENSETSKKLTQGQYKRLVQATMDHYFKEKLKLAKSKLKNSKPVVLWRYARVKGAFEDILSTSLIKEGLIKTPSDIKNIWMNGGGIEVENKLKPIINP
jgi:hypothetical protein